MVFSVLLAAILDFNINCVIVAQVFKHEIPQNKKGYFEHESQVVCPLCTQTWCIIMIMVTLYAILAAILSVNFERKNEY